MSLLNNKAREVLDYCLSSESPEVRSKVYEIINRSGLEPDDPMFLVLALTGQMRVFLEAAPEQLGQLLTEWKGQSALSLSELYAAIAIVKETQQQQADTIARNLEGVSSKCVSDIKSAGMATVSAISSANQETLDQVGGTWWIASQRYNHPNNVFGRDVVDWNIERINHCQETENPKCTVWIVPPGSPQRGE